MKFMDKLFGRQKKEVLPASNGNEPSRREKEINDPGGIVESSAKKLEKAVAKGSDCNFGVGGNEVMIAAIRHDTLMHLRQTGATEIECDSQGNVMKVKFDERKFVTVEEAKAIIEAYEKKGV